MIHRILLIAALASTGIYAAPMTIVFSGNATGSLGANAFSNQPFTITFTSDTIAVSQGTTCCVDDYTTPSGTLATFTFGSAGSGSLTEDQAVFVHQSEANLGIWHYNGSDFLDVGNPVFATYTESSTLAATSGTTFTFPAAQSMGTSAGSLILNSVTGVTVAVTVGAATPQTPVISSAGTAYSTGIAQNTWIAIVGSNLVPSSTPAAGASWTGSGSFASNQLPTTLDGVSVTVNGKPAYVDFYCSGSTAGSICTKDQINALTPLDSTTGPIQVVVSNGSLSSAPTTISMTTVSPAMLEFKLNYVTATHADYSLLGPTTLYPGFSTPASVGETIVLWTIGYGLPTTALTADSSAQTGALPTMPVCQINGAAATVSYAGVVSPGLYQLNVEIPNGAQNGDNAISCSYGGATTQSGLLITVAR